MTWLLFAILGHLGNGVVFVVEKGLLATDSRAGDPVRLAFYSSIISVAAAMVLPLDFLAPTMDVVAWSFVAGILFVGALVTFFYALDKGEASRVVPITGSSVPLFTMIFAALFVGERLSSAELLGVLVLVVGGALLSVKLSTRGLSFPVIVIAIIAGACFAGYFAAVKHVYTIFPSFWSGFAYSRIAVALAGLVLLWPFIRNKKPVFRRSASATQSIIGFFFGSKILGALAFIAQNYAISLGSVTVVNSLQGIQYLFVFLAALLLSRLLPRLYSEEHTKAAIVQKVTGTALIGLGLLLVV